MRSGYFKLLRLFRNFGLQNTTDTGRDQIDSREFAENFFFFERRKKLNCQNFQLNTCIKFTFKSYDPKWCVHRRVSKDFYVSVFL